MNLGEVAVTLSDIDRLPGSIFAIDPGPTESAYVLVEFDDSGQWMPRNWEKAANTFLLAALTLVDAGVCAIEMIASYGMPVGAEVFDTCVWIGRFTEVWRQNHAADDGPRLVYRKDVKLHICGDSRAKDANIRQALIDRFGGKDAAIGRKASPGPLYGMTGDCWSALAVAITAAETTPNG